MAEYRVQGPGGKIIVLQGPDGASDEEIIRQAQALSKPAASRVNPRRVSEGLADSLYKGLPFGTDYQSAVGALRNKPLETAAALMGGPMGYLNPVNALVAPILSRLGQGGRDEMAAQREQLAARSGQYAQEYPNAAALAQGTGLAAGALLPGPKGLNALARPVNAATTAGRAGQVAGNAMRAGVGAGTEGAVYGLGYGDTVQERGASSAMGAVGGFTAGGLIPALGGAMQVRGARSGPSATSQAGKARTLTDAGVSLLPGQRYGGLAKTAEDLGKRAPILGTAIRGAAKRSEVTLNRAVANRALEPIGEGVPKDVETGFDSVKHVATRLGQTYDQVADMAPSVSLDEGFAAGMQRIGARQPDLSESVSRDFERILKDRIARLGSGATGREVMGIKEEIGEIAADALASENRSDRLMGRMLMEVSDELSGLIGRQYPDAATLLDKADAGWAMYARLRNAASKGTDGIFTPGQLRTAVRMEDGSVSKGSVAKGEALLQDLSNASTIMPDGYGNPGTADTAAAIGLGGLSVANPVAGATTAGALTAAATPYFMMGRKVLEQLPTNAGPADVAAAQKTLQDLAGQDPEVSKLLELLSLRFSRGAGIGAAATAQPAQ